MNILIIIIKSTHTPKIWKYIEFKFCSFGKEFRVSYCGRRKYNEFKCIDGLWAQHIKCNNIMIESMKSCKKSLNKTLNDKTFA